LFGSESVGWQEFAKDLERFRHEQAKEIEDVRHAINSLFNRVNKIHERESKSLLTFTANCPSVCPDGVSSL